MSATVSSVPRLTFFSNTGTPLSGGLVYTYAAGTLTPKTFYSNEAKSVPVSNPIVLNSAGRPVVSSLDSTEVNLYYSGSAKFVVKDSGGSTLYTCDNVEEVAVAGSTLAFPLTVTGGTTGAIPYFSAATTLAVTAQLGLDALVLGGGSGIAPFTDANWTIEQTAHSLSSATQPRAVVYNNSVQSIASGASTTLTFDTESVDVGGMHSTSANTSRLTVPTGAGGFYFVFGSTRFASNAGTAQSLSLMQNGATALRGIAQIPSGTQALDLQVQWAGVLAAGDYVEMQASQNSGGNINVGAAASANVASTLSAVKLW